MSDIYLDPQLARWLGSMEGVPEWPEPAEAPVERRSRTTLQNQVHQVFGWLGTLCPGVALALANSRIARLAGLPAPHKC